MNKGTPRLVALILAFLVVAAACSAGDSTDEPTNTFSGASSTSVEDGSTTTSVTDADPDMPYVIDFDGNLDPPDFGTSTDLAQAREANNGRLASPEALDLFAAVFGDMPGADGSRFEPRPGDGSLAIRAALRVWDELTPDQQRAIEAELNPLGPEAASALEAIPVAFQANTRRMAGVGLEAEVAGAQAALEAALGRPLGLPVTVQEVPTDTWPADDHGGRTLADAAGTRDGVVAGSGTASGCTLRVAPGVTFNTLVHEVFHCFQYDAVSDIGIVLSTQDWIVEGSAEWVGARVGGADDLTSARGIEWVGNTGSIFALDYAGVGFFWTIEDLGVNPFEVVLDMLGKEGEEAVAATGLDPSAVLPRIPSEMAEAHRASPTYSVSPIWQLTAPDGPHQVARMVGTVTRSDPLDRSFVRGRWAPLYPGQLTIDDEGFIKTVRVRVTADAGFVEFEDKETHEVFGSFDKRFCLREEGCTCGPEDEIDSELPEGSENLLLTGSERDGGELRFRVELDEPDGFPDGKWEGAFLVTSIRFGIDGGTLTGETRAAPFSLTVDHGAVTGEYTLIMDQRIDADGLYADGVGTLQGVLSGCSYLPVMRPSVVSFDGVVDTGEGPVPFVFSQPTGSTPGTRPWDFETITEDFVDGRIDAAPDIAFMRASGLDWVDDVTITFEANRVG